MATWGNSVSQRQHMASPNSHSLSLFSESCVGPEEMAEGNGMEGMSFDPSDCFAPATNSITEKQENYTPSRINAAPAEKETIAILHVPASSISSKPISNQNDLRQADFTNYVRWLLDSSSVGPEKNVIPDTVRFGLTSVVQYLQDHNAELTRATPSERAIRFMEAHQAEKPQFSEGKMQELNRRLENVSKEHFDALCQLRGVRAALNISQTELQDCKERVIKRLQVEKLNATENANAKAEASAQEVRRLPTDLEENLKVEEDMMLERSRLMTKCRKLEAQLAQIDQNTGTQEYLNLSFYADDHVHPSMLQEFARMSVDNATETLAKFLDKNSVTSRLSLESESVEGFVGRISVAIPEELSSIFEVKYTWSHWICFVMFKGFEDVFFDVDSRLFTSPVNAKQDASTYFKSFHQKKYKPSSKLYMECHMIRAFCRTKYPQCFPRWLVYEGFSEHLPDPIRFDDRGRFSGDESTFELFLDVAKAVWLLIEPKRLPD